jgi:signal transduction histidine kinase
MSGLLDTVVPAGHGDHLIAVVREALANAAKHARATAVDVAAEAAPAGLRLLVTDNGCGLDPAAARRSGLANMQDRAADLGGTFTVGPHDPAGTRLEWYVPLPED